MIRGDVMKEYVLYGLDEELYDVLLLCLSHKNVFSLCEEIRKEPLIKCGRGNILLDQLLVTGNGNNRFVIIPYEYGVIDFSKAHNTTVNSKIRELSVELLKANIASLHNTILTDTQQEMVRNRKAI